MAYDENRNGLASTGETKRGGYDGMVVDKILARERAKEKKRRKGIWVISTYKKG